MVGGELGGVTPASPQDRYRPQWAIYFSLNDGNLEK